MLTQQKELVDLTPKEVYDRLEEASLNGSFPSVIFDQNSIKGYSCRYRGDNNKKCAFGIFITDENYKSEYEGYSASGIIVNNIKIPRWSSANFWDDIQQCHDYEAKNPVWDHASFMNAVKQVFRGYGIAIISV